MMEKEYKVVIYNETTKLEEYEYFTNKKDAIKYAKNMSDKNTRVAIYLYNNEDIELIEEF